MAQKVQVFLTDDLEDGEVEATETVSFALDGQSYEIDLCDENAVKLREAFAVYVGAARRATRNSSPKAPRQTRLGPDPREVREWAQKQGIGVPERGRLPKDVTEKYEAAQKKAKKS